jgi:hypothetical protein
MQTQTNTAVVVTHDVESYERWKTAFDAHAGARRGAGIISTHINRHAEDPNRLSVYFAATDAGKLGAFLESRDLASTMLDAGVKGPPSVIHMTPVEDATAKRPTAGVIVRHKVRDYDTWKRAFDGHAAARAAAGIVGHAVNRLVADPNTVVVYMQADSLDALRAFTSSPDLAATMRDAGVEGPPAFAFAQGGAWEA